MRRLLAGLAVLGWLLVTAASPAAAEVSGDCTVTFNGVDVARIDALTSPLELRARETLVFSGTAPRGTTTARVAIIAGPVTIDAAATAYATPTEPFTVTIDLDELAPYAVGLYRVRGTTDGCTAEAWLRITGRFPLATLAGLTGAGLALGGVAGQLGAIASRRRWARLAAMLGGVITGTGAAVLIQQFGRLQPSYPALAGCIAAGMMVGYLLASVFDRAGRERRRRRRLEDVPLPVMEAAGRVMAPARTEPEAPAAEPTPPAGPYWGYVLTEVEVFDLTDHTRVVGRLRPGSWYLVKREVGSWAHVTGGGGLEGWAARSTINRQG